MNRAQRRHPDAGGAGRHEAPPQVPEEELGGTGRQQDDFDVRAKNSGHKKTADKWNQ